MSSSAPESAAQTSPGTTVVDVFVDPGCPFAWQTTRWLREVESQRPIDLRWHLMSLAVLNEGGDIPPEWETAFREGTRRLRVLQAAVNAGGEQAIPALYEAMGQRIHPEGRRDEGTELIVEALDEAGLPADLAAAADDESLDPQVRAAHERAMAAYGEDMGTPLIAVNGTGFFGPVITQVPRGEAAAAAWDATLAMVSIPGFYEIKRRRDLEIDFD